MATAVPIPVAAQLKNRDLFRETCYIDGRWIEVDANTASIAVDNPATGEIIGRVPRLGRAETRDAITAADRALPGWRALTAKERAVILRRWFDLIMTNQEDLARLMTLEQGKPLVESRGEVAYGASFIEWFAEEGKRAYGDTIPSHARDKRIVVIKQPIGVVGCITPWNFPIAMITRKVGTGTRGRMHGGRQTGFPDAVQRAGAGGPERARRYSGRRLQRRDRLRHRDRCRADVEPDGPQDLVHGIDRDRQGVDGAVRRHRQEDVARTRWQCAVHRVRRCRSRCGGGRRDRLEVSQHRSDLRLCQSAVGAGVCLRSLCGKAGRGGRRA